MQAHVTLPPSLTIDTIESLLHDLEKTRLTRQGLAVDAAQVEVITPRGVQLVLAISHSLAAAHAPLTVMNPSDAFAQAFQTLGLSAQLSKWSAKQ